MSILPFTRNFVAAKGNHAIASAIAALVRLDPESASLADLRTMEEDLDKTGLVVQKLVKELQDEQRERARVKTRYDELMAAAELLDGQVKDSTITRPGIEASLKKVLDELEEIAPELRRDDDDIEQTEKLLAEAREAYEAKAEAIKVAKSNLERARHDLMRANLKEERAREHAQQAATVAGLRQNTVSGLNVALNSMKQSADEARARAAAADMKTSVLDRVESSPEDRNIAEALAQVRGTAKSEVTLSDRLVALKRG